MPSEIARSTNQGNDFLWRRGMEDVILRVECEYELDIDKNGTRFICSDDAARHARDFGTNAHKLYPDLSWHFTINLFRAVLKFSLSSGTRNRTYRLMGKSPSNTATFWEIPRTWRKRSILTRNELVNRYDDREHSFKSFWLVAELSHHSIRRKHNSKNTQKKENWSDHNHTNHHLPFTQ
jgi:hypothetical protein